MPGFKNKIINIPKRSECLRLLENYTMADEKIMAHCIKVAETAVKVCFLLPKDLLLFDIHLIEAAALLHDMARKEPNHAIKGAEILRAMGFGEVADIVLEHMDLRTTPHTALNEKEILFFADKLVAGNQFVMDVEKRFKEKLIRYKADPEAVEAINARLETFSIIREKLSIILKKDVIKVLQSI